MALSEIRSHITSIEKDETLFEEKSFDKRIDAIDFIEFLIIDRIDSLLQKKNQTQLVALKQRAEKVKARLEEIDIILFKRLREDIRVGTYKGKEFKELINEYVVFQNHEKEGYDNLDIFINNLLSMQGIPEQTKDLDPEMVFFQKTPGRIIFELTEKIHFTDKDVFFDLGSGLGQVAILINLLTGVTAKGVEFEPAFCDYANNCAKQLNSKSVTFINADAHEADYSDGTVFFMYTPFRGEMLLEVLNILKKQSLHRKIKIITYGPCTAEVALQDWLEFVPPKHDSVYKLGIFSS